MWSLQLRLLSSLYKLQSQEVWVKSSRILIKSDIIIKSLNQTGSCCLCTTVPGLDQTEPSHPTPDPWKHIPQPAGLWPRLMKIKKIKRRRRRRNWTISHKHHCVLGPYSYTRQKARQLENGCLSSCCQHPLLLILPSLLIILLIIHSPNSLGLASGRWASSI